MNFETIEIKDLPKMKLYRVPFGEDLITERGKANKVPLPVYATDGSAAFDLYSANTEEIAIMPGETEVVPLGIKVAVQRGYKLVLKCRSGLSAKGIIVANSPGTIDCDYRGEVKVVITNLSERKYILNPLTRICQGEIEEAPRYQFEEVESVADLGETIRGSNGMGSTGEKFLNILN